MLFKLKKNLYIAFDVILQSCATKVNGFVFMLSPIKTLTRLSTIFWSSVLALAKIQTTSSFITDGIISRHE